MGTAFRTFPIDLMRNKYIIIFFRWSILTSYLLKKVIYFALTINLLYTSATIEPHSKLHDADANTIMFYDFLQSCFTKQVDMKVEAARLRCGTISRRADNGLKRCVRLWFGIVARRAEDALKLHTCQSLSSSGKQ